MNILLLSPQPFFQYRGTAIATRLLVEALCESGHRIHMLTYHEGENIDLPNLIIQRIPKIPGLSGITPGFSFKKLICDLILSCLCFRVLREKKFDILHCNEESVFIALIIGKIFRLPYVYDMDSCLSEQMIQQYPLLVIFKNIMTRLERIAVRNSVGVLAVCQALKDKTLNLVPKAFVKCIEDVSLLDKVSSLTGSPKDCIRSKNPLILYAGNLEPYQGIDLLLKSLKYVRSRNPDVKLVIIGGTDSQIKEYEKVVHSYCLDDTVRFLGQKPVNLLGFFLKQADILVSPRLSGDNTPMKIYSYMDSGVPLVATHISAHTQVLNNQTAILTPPDPLSMANGILFLLDFPESGKQLAAEAKKTVQSNFSQEAFSQKVIMFYEFIEKQIKS